MQCHVCGEYGHEATSAGCPKHPVKLIEDSLQISEAGFRSGKISAFHELMDVCNQIEGKQLWVEYLKGIIQAKIQNEEKILRRLC